MSNITSGSLMLRAKDEESAKNVIAILKELNHTTGYADSPCFDGEAYVAEGKTIIRARIKIVNYYGDLEDMLDRTMDYIVEGVANLYNKEAGNFRIRYRKSRGFIEEHLAYPSDMKDRLDKILKMPSLSSEKSIPLSELNQACVLAGLI